MSASNSGISFPKWQIAVALGATGAIGLGYWYLRQSSVKSRKPNLAEGSSKASLSLDEGDEELSPLELSQKAKVEGNNYFKRGKYDEAINHYNKAIELCPPEKLSEMAVYYQNRAAAYEQLKKWSSVISDCSKAIELNDKYEKALYRRAKAYEAIKDYELCLEDITAVCLLQEFQNQTALMMTDRVLRELGRRHAAEAYKNRVPKLASKQYIKTYFMSFSEDPVYKFLMDTSQLIPDEHPTGFLRAKLAFATENFEDVKPACTEEIQDANSKYFYEALSLRATFNLLMGAQDEALEDIKQIIDSEKVNPKIKTNALIKRATLSMQLEDATSCLKDFEMAAELCPEVSDVFHHRGQVYLLLDKTTEAQDDFTKAVQLNPDFPIAVVQKCYAEYRFASATRNVDLLMQSLSNFRQATERFPSCSEAFVLFAQTLTEREQFEQAEEMYNKAYEIDPKNAAIQVHRGLLLLQWKANINEAVECMKKAIEIDDRCEFAYETLGTVEVQRGNLILAIDLFNKAIDLARTEMEMTHLFSLRDAAVCQLKVVTKLGIGAQRLGQAS